MFEKALENLPTLIAVVGLLAMLTFDRLKKRAGDADAADAAKVDAALELGTKNTENIRDLTNTVKNFGEKLQATDEHSVKGLSNHAGRIGDLEGWRTDLRARLEPVFEDHHSRTVTFATREDAAAARRTRKR